VTVCIAAVGLLALRPSKARQSPELVTTEVWTGPFEHALVEQGNVESASSFEIDCEVRARGGNLAILEVVPEGTLVKAGDMVVQLDDSGLKIEENDQKILIASRQSLLAEAHNTLEAAKIAKLEYLEGLFIAQEKELDSLRFAAERNKETAAATFETAKDLYADAIYAASQVEAAHAGVEEAGNAFEAADTALDTLRNLTRRKELALMDANIAAAEANVQAQLQSLRLEQERLEFIQDQIAKCTIRAPADGQVAYANESDYRGTPIFIVAPGTIVRERQTILYLPNPREMQVRTSVNEARITLVRPGMPALVRVTALGETLEAEVTKVSEYAEPSFYSTINIKRYATCVKIKNPPADLRVGMHAEVRIFVERMPQALQVPVQALAESNGRYFALVKTEDTYETREVQLRSTNDQVAAIASGLTEGDEVVLNPRTSGGLLELPAEDAPTFVTDADTLHNLRRASVGAE
jgi:multidrug efflux pump subunit AcrA (membrane-fusion protein)